MLLPLYRIDSASTGERERFLARVRARMADV
jgi:hypothetical protein